MSFQHLIESLLSLRNRHFFGLDFLLLSFTPLLALAMRTDGLNTQPEGWDLLSRYVPGLVVYTLVALAVRLAVFRRFGLYSRYWRYASIEELDQISWAVLVSTLVLVGVVVLARLGPLPRWGFPLWNFPRSVVLIDGLLALLVVGGSRFSVRLATRWRAHGRGDGRRRVLVMGAGDAGVMIVREMQRSPRLGLEPVGFLDDDAGKEGVRIHGVPVLGTRYDIPRLVHTFKVRQVIIAMPTAPGQEIREIVGICEQAGAATKIIPGIYELLNGSVSVKHLRDVQIEDLLRREPVQTDTTAVAALVRGKRVLVTGGGGSIGSELCRQIWRCGPAELVILGHGENSIFAIHNELKAAGGGEQVAGGRWQMADGRWQHPEGTRGGRWQHPEGTRGGKGQVAGEGDEWDGQQGAGGQGAPGANGHHPTTSGQPPAANGHHPTANGHQPAASSQQPTASSQQPAATSQQPTASSQQLRAVIADVRFPERLQQVFAQVRPEIVFHAAAHKHVPLMEMNPAEAVTNNILGTKNVLDAAVAAGVERFVMISTDKAVNPSSMMGASKRAAELLVLQAAQRTGRAYGAVRFGNVLGSRGSVVLTFQEQIRAGGPVTVTHPEMKRFFMTIPEAVQLVLQAAVLGKGGEVFVLDMGEPVKIVDLARDLIELSGLAVGVDVDIVYSGLRPGEKLYEELFIKGEQYARTRHEKIFIAHNASTLVAPDLARRIQCLHLAAAADDRPALYRHLQELIPEYCPPPAARGVAVAVADDKMTR